MSIASIFNNLFSFFAFFSSLLSVVKKAATSAGKKRKGITKRELNKRVMPKKKCKECTNKIIKLKSSLDVCKTTQKSHSKLVISIFM